MNEFNYIYLMENLGYILLPIIFSVFVFNIFRIMCARTIHDSRVSKSIYYMFAWFLTPIHELSHLIVAVIFGHKINKVVLFQLNNSGTLGYVQHSWNRNSFYQTFGCFFIAIAPLLTSITLSIYMISNADIDFKILKFDVNTIVLLWNKFGTIDLIVISLVSFYCTPSNEDFKNSLKGFVYVSVFVVVYIFVSNELEFGQQSIKNLSVYILLITFISSIFSSMYWLFLFTVGVLTRRAGVNV